MPSNRYPLIAREGWPLLLVLSGLALLLCSIFGASMLFYTLPVICVFLYLLRDPQRTIPSSPSAIVSPVHGKVIAISNVNDSWLDREAICIQLKMSILDVYSLRSPIEGKVVEQWTRCQGPGQKQFAFWVRTDDGDDVVTVFKIKACAVMFPRIYIQSGERLGQGQRCGYIYLGGDVEVLLPANSILGVKVGQYINAGTDVIAHLIHAETASTMTSGT